MDSRARVEAALAGGEVDRPPAGAWGHRYRDEWSPDRLAEVTVDRATRFGWDFVKFQPRATFFAEAFGPGFVKYVTQMKRNEVNRFLGEVTDWEMREYFEFF